MLNYYDTDASDADYEEFENSLRDFDREEKERIDLLRSRIEALRSVAVPPAALVAHNAAIRKAETELADIA